MTTAGSGPPSRSAFAYFDPALCFWRTSQPTLFEELGTSSPTWPDSGTWDLGFAYAHPMSEPPTSASGCSSSPDLLKTPTAQLAINGGSQHPDKRKAGGHGPTLADEVEHLLPTPNASFPGTTANFRQDGTAYGNGYGPTLLDAVRLMPTPMAAGSERTSATMTRGNPTLLGALLPTPRATDGTKGGPNQRGSSGDLMLPSAVVRLSAPTPPPSAAGKPFSAEQLPLPWTSADA